MKQVISSSSTERQEAARRARAEQRHRELDGRLEVLRRKAWLSTEEQVEVSRLKKLKLQAKDELARLALL